MLVALGLPGQRECARATVRTYAIPASLAGITIPQTRRGPVCVEPKQ